MGHPLSIRFQAPERVTGPAKDVFVLLMDSLPSADFVERAESEPVALRASPEQDALSTRNLRVRFRSLERERALKTVDGIATLILTDSICFNPELGRRVDTSIVGDGLGTGRIIYGPHEFCLPAGHYIAVIEFQVTSLPDSARVRVAGEVILNNQKYLSQQRKNISAKGSYIFRLPFTVTEPHLLDYAAPALEIRLNLRGIVGIVITQVAVVYRARRAASILAYPISHLRSASNASIRWIGKKILKTRV
jgi:hypothetical protein